MVLADFAGIAQTIPANTTPQRGSEWTLEGPLPKDLVANVEKSAPDFTVILTEDNGGQYIGGMNFGMAIAPATTVASRQSAKTFIRAPVSLPTLPAPDKYPHV
jgi:hypothetical protein